MRASTPRWLAVCALCSLAGALWACGGDVSDASPPSGAHASGASAAADPGDALPGAVPGSTAGTPPEQQACVAELAAELPAAVAALLADLGYRDALADACTAQRAVEAGDAVACDGLTAGALRAGCRRRLAVRHGRPDECPRLLDRGRDPLCLAWAARAPARCAAVSGTQVLVCRAPFEGNLALCRELGVEREPCEAAVAQVGPWLETRERGALPSVSGQLTARFVAADAPAPPSGAVALEMPVELDLTHGVYVARERCTATLQLAPERRTLAHRERLQLTSFLVRLGALADEAMRDVTCGAEVLNVGLLPMVGTPGVSVLVGDSTRGAPTRAEADPAPQLGGSVLVRTLQPSRGGEVALEVDVTVTAEGGAYRLTGELHTFVRDIDPQGECQDHAGLL